jgi:hypothetical protein
MRKITAAIAVAGLVLSTAPSFAVPAAKPSEIAPVIKAPEPYGKGTLRWLLIPAYDAALWTDAAQWSMQSPFALTLKYHMSFSTSDIVERSLKEMTNVDPQLSATTLASYRALLTRSMPDVKSGDVVTGLYMPDGTVKFFRDGQPTGQVRDPEFAQNFFAIWLSPQTSEPSLRAKLLRQSS